MTAEVSVALNGRRIREWPATGLELESLSSRGWRPTPFREFVVKLHSRCNLACDHCYVYAMGDETWRSQASTMAPETVEATAWRIAEHVRAHNLDDVRVVLHGGEPLLAGHRRLGQAVTLLREAIAPVPVALSVQTNGVLLSEPMLEVLLAHDVAVGVSLDGDATGHDRHRRRRSGGGTHTDVMAGLSRLRAPRFERLYAGLLCTVDLANDPLQTYEALAVHAPPRIDFLLPHGNWTGPPPGRDTSSATTPYGDWLIAAFDHWYDSGSGAVRIRLFEEVIALVLGGASHSELVGLSPAAMVVIDTNGAIEQVDALRSAHHGAAATELTVFTDPFDAALSHPGVVARQIGVAGLSPTCRACDVHTVCGAGYYPHRYRRGAGYRNPSVYCPDLYRVITHIRDRVRRDVATLASSADLRRDQRG